MTFKCLQICFEDQYRARCQQECSCVSFETASLRSYRFQSQSGLRQSNYSSFDLLPISVCRHHLHREVHSLPRVVGRTLKREIGLVSSLAGVLAAKGFHGFWKGLHSIIEVGHWASDHRPGRAHPRCGLALFCALAR
jgi:hypothetical protein